MGGCVLRLALISPFVFPPLDKGPEHVIVKLWRKRKHDERHDEQSFSRIRIMLLMICCVLFMPPHGHAGESKETQSFRMASLTLAVSGISNPVSQLKTFAESDGTSLRSPGKRQQNASTGFDGGDAPAALPPRLPCPTSSSALRSISTCPPVRRKVTGSSTGSPSLPLPLRTSSYGRSSRSAPADGHCVCTYVPSVSFQPRRARTICDNPRLCADCLLTRASQRDHGPRTLQEDFSCVPCVGAPASRC